MKTSSGEDRVIKWSYGPEEKTDESQSDRNKLNTDLVPSDIWEICDTTSDTTFISQRTITNTYNSKLFQLF